MSFQKSLIALRAKAHLSQDALAGLMGVSRQTVSKWETGSTYPELAKISALCHALNTTADVLFETSDSVNERDNCADEFSGETVGNNIRNLRLSAGISQEAFGEAIDISRQTVSRWESGAILPEVETFIRILSFYKVSAGSLLYNHEKIADAREIAVIPSENADDKPPAVSPLGAEQKDSRKKSAGVMLFIAATVLTVIIIILIIVFGRAPHGMPGNVTDTIGGNITDTSEADTSDTSDVPTSDTTDADTDADTDGEPERQPSITVREPAKVTVSEPDTENEFSLTAESTVELLSFHEILGVADGYTWRLSENPDRSDTVDSGCVILPAGQSEYYITLSDGNEEAVYKFNVYRLHMYTVSFENTAVKLHVQEGERIDAPSVTASKAHCVFNGWDYDFENTVVLRDTVIKAIWSPATVKIIYHTNGGTLEAYEDYIDYGSSGYATPSRGNDVFSGWYTSAQLQYRAGEATADVTELYAAWNDEMKPYLFSYSEKNSCVSVQFNEETLSIATEIVVPAYINDCPVTEITDIPKTVKTLVIPATVTEIGEDRLYFSNNLEKVVFLPGSGLKIIGDYCFEYISHLTDLSIPDGVTHIGAGAFGYCEKLRSICIPGSVGFIGQQTFEACLALQDVILEDGIKAISAEMFLNCTSLSSVTLPESLERIDAGAFRLCNSLKSIMIPNGIVYIDKTAFDGTPSDLKIIFRGTPEQWNEAYLGNNDSINVLFAD